jgi:hypothetical protein
MAFPNDLSDVVVFKIHPAIRVARVANNDDYYMFGTDPGSYKSNKVMKRQAVQFRIFAYGDNHVGLGELTPQVMTALGIKAVWSAKVANRKVARLEGTSLTGTAFVVSAEATSNDANGGKLVGSLPAFAEGAAIPLGQITGGGLFIPPKGGVYRKTAGVPIKPYPALSKEHADTTCDGSVSVRLTKGRRQFDVLPACIVVAPQDFSPDTNEQVTLYDFLRAQLHIPPGPGPGTIHNDTARRIDAEALNPGTSDFNPGVEVSFGSRGEVTNLPALFYQAAQDPRIDPREIRVRYRAAPTDAGAVTGQLTSGLCSTWQGDYTACKGYWVEHLPIEVYLDEDTSTSVSLFRRKYADTGLGVTELTTGDDFNDHVDQIGVARLRNAKKVETERDPGDDI